MTSVSMRYRVWDTSSFFHISAGAWCSGFCVVFCLLHRIPLFLSSSFLLQRQYKVAYCCVSATRTRHFSLRWARFTPCIQIYVFARVYLDERLLNQAPWIVFFQLRDIWSAAEIPHITFKSSSLGCPRHWSSFNPEAVSRRLLYLLKHLCDRW